MENELPPEAETSQEPPGSPGDPKSITNFLEACAFQEPGGRVAVTELFRAYEKWAKRKGVAPVGQFLFGLELGKTYHSEASGRFAEWVGLRLRPGL